VNTIESLKVGRPWISALLTYAAFSRLTRSKGCGRLPAGDIDIYYKRFGCGEPVLLLHGGFMVSEGWAAQMPALARDHMVIAMDSRGHGRTNLGTAPLTYRQMGRDVANFIERLGVGPAHVIGSSDGGIAGLALALERPDLLRSLVLLGTSFNTSNYSREAMREIDRFLSPRAPVLLGLRGLRRLMNPEPWTGRRFVASMRKLWTTLPDFTVEELGTICTPTLVIGCDKDEFLSLSDDPLEVFRETAAAMPNAELAVIPGGTHTVNINRPGVVNELILNFIASV
jgi:pimeloyl-ACP methyl ester carboxylesterase